MTILEVTDKVGLGKLIIAAATDEDLRRRLLANATEVLRSYVNIPEGHQIKAIPASDKVTLMMLPQLDDLREGRREVAYPTEYDSRSPDHIDPEGDSERAFAFLIGDYVLKNCK